MSLISQNALAGRRKEKNRVDEAEGNESHLVRGEEGVDVSGEPGSTNFLKRKNRKRRGDGAAGVEKGADLQKAEEERLEKFLFSSLYSRPEFGREGDEDGRVVMGAPPAAAHFFIDKTGGDGLIVYEEDLEGQIGVGCEQLEESKKPAWYDDEEEHMSVDVTKVNRLRKLREKADESVISGSDYVSRLRAQHVKLNPGTDWAKVGSNAHRRSSSDDESDDGSGITVSHSHGDIGDYSILQSNDDLIVKGGTRLLPGLLEYSRLVDANIEESSNGPINSVQFHRNAQLLLAAGLDRRLRFFQVDGKRNTKVESVFIDDCPIRKASFLPDGSQVIIGGRRKFFYSFDLVKATVDKVGPLTGRDEKSLEVFEVSPDSNTIAFVGNEGYILLVSSKTKELIGTLKMNGSARSLAFADDGNQLLSNGGDGHIYHWDLRTRKCVHKAFDEGCLVGSALCTSPDSSLFAAGSSSGIVNVYKREEFIAGKRKPLKTIENLTTNVDFLKFNHDSQILALGSCMKKNSLKLVHLPSYTVFSNWPAARSSLQYPRCLDFSPNGGFMAVGNAAGKILTLLGKSLTSKAPLTETFLQKSECRPKEQLHPITSEGVATGCGREFKATLVKNRARDVVMCAEIGEDTLDLPSSFLTIPICSIIRLVGKASQLGCVENLYQSVENLCAIKYCAKLEKHRDMLLGPKLATHFGCSNQFLETK